MSCEPTCRAIQTLWKIPTFVRQGEQRRISLIKISGKISILFRLLMIMQFLREYSGFECLCNPVSHFSDI